MEKLKKIDFDNYVKSFDYQERVDMKIQKAELFKRIK